MEMEKGQQGASPQYIAEAIDPILGTEPMGAASEVARAERIDPCTRVSSGAVWTSRCAAFAFLDGRSNTC
jgi:hypothetical protein